MQENINQKKCFKCNCLNLEDAVTCVNCGTQIGFNNYPTNIEQATETQTELINKQIINNEESSINKEPKKEKNASQMMWIFIGNWIFYSIVGTLVQGVIENFIKVQIILMVLPFAIEIGVLYLTSTRIFLKNTLYKNQKALFINKLRNFYEILFIIMLVLNLLIQRTGISYIIENGVSGFFGEAFAISLVTTIISLIIGYIIYPKVIIIPLINKHGTESVNEEVRS